VSIAEEQPAADSIEAVEPVLSVRGLHIERVRPGRVDTIVNGIDLSVGHRETIGIVGESGSGKSMTARAIIGLLPPTLVASGEILFDGGNLLAQRERQWRAIRGRNIGMIMQDPYTMLNPVKRCGSILEESLRPEHKRGMSRARRRDEAIRRLAEVEIHDPHVVDRYPFQLSGGMQQRIGIAAALASEPRLLIADEPSTALDVTTQREVLALIKRLQEARGMSLILITHDLRVAFAMCDRIYVLYAGALVEVGRAAPVEDEPLHPYTHGLLLSEPSADSRMVELVAIPGSVPAADDVTDCCPFAARCRWARPRCRDGSPPLRRLAPDHLSACIRIDEIRPEMAALRRRSEAHKSLGPNPAVVRGPAFVEIANVRKVFHGGKRDVVALDGVSLEISTSESVGLVGESGSGKTTLARILVGLEKPTEGAIRIDDVDVSDWSKLRAADRRRMRAAVQIVFQDPYSSLNPMRTVGSTLSEVITKHNGAARNIDQQVNELLLSVGLAVGHAKRKPIALSGGERQRVAIARALAVKPRMLICDEPVSALDVSVQAQILNLFATIRATQGVGYLFVTHDLAIVRQIAEYVYVMYRGRIVESGPVDQVLTEPREPYTVKLLESIPRSDPSWLSNQGLSSTTI
jgi:peptide/nickel transport system ATP-binding protein